MFEALRGRGLYQMPTKRLVKDLKSVSSNHKKIQWTHQTDARIRANIVA